MLISKYEEFKRDIAELFEKYGIKHAVLMGMNSDNEEDIFIRNYDVKKNQGVAMACKYLGVTAKDIYDEVRKQEDVDVYRYINDIYNEMSYVLRECIQDCVDGNKMSADE